MCESVMCAGAWGVGLLGALPGLRAVGEQVGIASVKRREIDGAGVKAH